MELAIIALVILVALSAFFSGSEAALLSVGRIRLQYLLKSQKKSAAVLSLSRLKANPQKMIMAILIGNNVVNISASFLAAYITTEIFGDLYLGLAGGITIFTLLVFGEIIPKNYATANSDSLALFVAQPIELLTFIL
jgi:putative hemolysin